MDAARWHEVLKALGFTLKYGAALTYTLSSLFFGNLAPAFIGIDAFRATQMYRQGFPTEVAVRSVLADRLATFISLMVVIGLGLPLLANIVEHWTDLLLFVGVWLAGCFALLGVVFMDLGRKVIPSLYEWSITAHISKFANELKAIMSQGKTTILIITYGSAVHIVRCVTFYALAHVLGIELEFWMIFAIVPISLLIAMIPITIADWGIREAVFIYTLGLAGIASEQAFILSFMFGIYRVLTGIIGGFVWLLAKDQHYTMTSGQGAVPKDQLQKESAGKSI